MAGHLTLVEPPPEQSAAIEAPTESADDPTREALEDLLRVTTFWASRVEDGPLRRTLLRLRNSSSRLLRLDSVVLERVLGQEEGD